MTVDLMNKDAVEVLMSLQGKGSTLVVKFLEKRQIHHHEDGSDT